MIILVLLLVFLVYDFGQRVGMELAFLKPKIEVSSVLVNNLDAV